MEHSSEDQFSTTKYLIKINYSIKGIVNVMDIIGALFGQTEGLLNDLELRELQKTGRIGRIQVQNNADKGISAGQIIIPSSLDRVETAILAATIESVDRVGPCTAQMSLAEIMDIREDKRKQIMDRATELLQRWEQDTPESTEIGESILEKMRTGELIEYGSEKLPAGQDIENSQQIIIVEGVADVKALMRAGFRNAIATQGTHVPKTIIELSKKKSCIAFVDGDRGGQMILDELLQVADVDFVAIAPKGIMVEELTRKEIIKHLQNKISLQEYLHKQEQEAKERKISPRLIGRSSKEGQKRKLEKRFPFRSGRGDERKRFSSTNKSQLRSRDAFAKQSKKQRSRQKLSNNRSYNKATQQYPIEPADPIVVESMKTILASNEAVGLNEKNEQVFRVGNTQVFNTLDTAENTKILILDGVVTQRLLDKALQRNINKIYAINKAKNLDFPQDKQISVRLFKDYIQ